MQFNILFLGDIVGEIGRKAVITNLKALVDEYQADFVIVNGENSAGGRGITRKIAIALMRAGVSAITTGDHVWDQQETSEYIKTECRLLRPYNYPKGTPGKGWVVLNSKKGKVGIINMQGSVFMNQNLDNPFLATDMAIQKVREETSLILIDFHAEATSEKIAMGYMVDGKVTALVGTHTHVQTADEEVLEKGTAYISDVGMCGPNISVLGRLKEPVIERFRTELPRRFPVARGEVRVSGVVVKADPETGKAISINRIRKIYQE